ncbi:hypothetical protein [Halomicrobium urmianum]|uniref:hypothetical protein n=1 Tax=Halomicrobium urmianum TaxID=1586233 RepID=UPI003570F178
MLADLVEGVFEGCDIIDRRKFSDDLVDECGPLDGGLVPLGPIDRFDANLAGFVPATVPAITCNLDTLVFVSCKDRVSESDVESGRSCRTSSVSGDPDAGQSIVVA